MMQLVMSMWAWVGVTALGAVIAAAFMRGRVRWGWLISALLLMALYDACLTKGFGLWPIDFGASPWNWEGKSLGVALSLIVASLPIIGWRRAGLTLVQDRQGLMGALLLSGLLLVLFLGLALMSDNPPFDAETLAFQLTMPGLDEELFYRGVLLLMLNEAFGRPVKILGAQMGWGAVVSSLAFGLTHAMSFGQGGLAFDPALMASTGLAALLLVWIREKTGSVLLPIVLHNYGNAIFMLV